jgi:putative flavoprotein involved in K+ transport
MTNIIDQPTDASMDERALQEIDGAIVIGAGPGGLAAGAAINHAGMRARIVERAETVGSSWRGYYDGLRLNSPRGLSSLPGATIDPGCGRWPLRDDVIVYLERYAREHCAEITLGVTVRSIARHDDGERWRVDTSDGVLIAPHVVVATGLNERPMLPPWPGRSGFEGELLHGSSYRNAKPYHDRDVLVVGSGMTGTDITLELLAIGARSVRMSVRTPPLIFRPQTLGVPASFMGYMVKRLPPAVYPLLDPLTLLFDRAVNGDLSAHGLQRPPQGLLSAMASRAHGITVDRGFLAAVKAGDIEIVPAVEALDGPDVVLVDGRRIQPGVVIAATGQRPVLEPLVGELGVLSDAGHPLVHGARTLAGAPGLHFIGYRLPPGQLPDMARDARAIARRLRRQADRE